MPGGSEDDLLGATKAFFAHLDSGQAEAGGLDDAARELGLAYAHRTGHSPADASVQLIRPEAGTCDAREGLRTSCMAACLVAARLASTTGVLRGRVARAAGWRNFEELYVGMVAGARADAGALWSMASQLGLAAFVPKHLRPAQLDFALSEADSAFGRFYTQLYTGEIGERAPARGSAGISGLDRDRDRDGDRDREGDVPANLASVLAGFTRGATRSLPIRPEHLYFVLMDGMRLDAWWRVQEEVLSACDREIAEIAGGMTWAEPPTVTDPQVQALRQAGFAGPIIDLDDPEGFFEGGATTCDCDNMGRARAYCRFVRFGFIDRKIHATSDPHHVVLDEVALGVQRWLIPWLAAMPARSLVVIVSDHGYRENSSPARDNGAQVEHRLAGGLGGPSRPRYAHGGNSMAEVIVPWSALLFRDAPRAWLRGSPQLPPR